MMGFNVEPTAIQVLRNLAMSPPIWSAVFLEFELPDLIAMDFIRTVGNAKQPGGGVCGRQSEVICHPGPTEGLNCHAYS